MISPVPHGHTCKGSGDSRKAGWTTIQSARHNGFHGSRQAISPAQSISAQPVFVATLNDRPPAGLKYPEPAGLWSKVKREQGLTTGGCNPHNQRHWFCEEGRYYPHNLQAGKCQRPHEMQYKGFHWQSGLQPQQQTGWIRSPPAKPGKSGTVLPIFP